MIYLQEMFVLLITLSFTEKNTIHLVSVDKKTFEMNLHCYDNQLVYFNALGTYILCIAGFKKGGSTLFYDVAGHVRLKHPVR